METTSFNNLLRELNYTERKYNVLYQQYLELQSIKLQDVNLSTPVKEDRTVLRKNNVSKRKETLKSKGCKVETEKKTGNPKNDSSMYKKLIKSRIKKYYAITANLEKIKLNEYRSKFSENLQQNNEEILRTFSFEENCFAQGFLKSLN